MSVDFVLRPAVATDAAWIAELRAVVMRPDLERLQRFDPVRVRERFLNGFQPEHTYIIHTDGVDAGVIAVRPEPDAPVDRTLLCGPGPSRQRAWAVPCFAM